MAKTTLEIEIDCLSRKVVRVNSDVAVGETFRIVFNGQLDWVPGETRVSIALCDIRRKAFWKVDRADIDSTSGEVELEGSYTINTADALEYAKKTHCAYIQVTTFDTTGYGEDEVRTYYGTAPLVLRVGTSEDGTDLTRYVESIREHDEDPCAHPQMFKNVEERIAVHERACVSSANAAADSAAVSSGAAKSAVDAMVEANKSKDTALDAAKVVENSVPEAKDAIAKARDSAIEAVNGAGTTAKSDVNAEKDKAVSAVQKAGDEEVEKVKSYADSAKKDAETALKSKESAGEYASKAEEQAGLAKQYSETASAKVDTVAGMETKIDEVHEAISVTNQNWIDLVNVLRQISGVPTDPSAFSLVAAHQISGV